MASLQPHVRRIANDTGAEVVLNDVGLEVYGLEEQVRLAVLAINAIAMIQVSSEVNTLTTGLWPRATIPDRTGQRAPRVHIRQEERQTQQDYEDGQCQDQV